MQIPLRTFWATTLFVAAALSLEAQTSANGGTAFTNVSIVDPESDTIQHNMTVVVRDDKIVAVYPSGRARPRVARVVSGRGKYLMPGLWDSHVHVLTSPDSGIGLSERAVESFFPLFLAHGVTSLRDMGGYADTMAVLRESIRTGTVLGPRIVSAGRLLGGRNPWAPASPHVALVLHGDSGSAAVARAQAEGSDFVKAHDMLSREAFLAIASAARAAGLPLVGHLRPSVTVLEAIAAGQTGIEHLPIELIAACAPGDAKATSNAWYQAWVAGGWQAYITGTSEMWNSRNQTQCREVLSALRAAGVHITPTTVLRQQDSSFSSRTAGLQARTPRNAANCSTDSASWFAVPEDLRRTAERTVREYVALLHSEGVQLMAGSDGPQGCLTPGIALHEELRALVKAGLTPREAIRSATVVPALFLGLGSSLGTISVGKQADLVLLNADPTVDIGNIGSIDGVMTAGRWMDRRELDRLIQQARRRAAAP